MDGTARPSIMILGPMADKVPLSSPFRPSSTILIFSSAEYCLRVARRMSLTTLSPWLFRVPLFGENAPLGPFLIPPTLSHLRSLVVTMCQKRSLIKSP